MINIIANQDTILIDTQWLTSLVSHILKELKYEDYDIGILFTTNDDMQQYNETYRSKKGPTDILSFRYHQLIPGERIKPLTEEDKNLGDLILAPEYIKTYTDKENILFEHRIMILIIHGICHLLGHDHEDDAEHTTMQSQESKLLDSLPKKLRR